LPPPNAPGKSNTFSGDGNREAGGVGRWNKTIGKNAFEVALFLKNPHKKVGLMVNGRAETLSEETRLLIGVFI
jgi:hypothetical protein